MALVLVDPLQTRGSMQAGVRSTFKNIFFTVAAFKACPITVTLVARKKHRHRYASLSDCQEDEDDYILILTSNRKNEYQHMSVNNLAT